MQLTKVRGGFIAGDRRRNLRVPGAPNFLPLVCYEIIFPGEAVPRSDRPGWLYDHIGRYLGWPFVAGSAERPGWLLNLTNDGWFGKPAPTSTSSRRACGQSKKGFRWCVRPIPGFPRWSIRSAASSSRCRSAPRAFSTRRCRTDRADAYARVGDGRSRL